MAAKTPLADQAVPWDPAHPAMGDVQEG